MTIDKGSSILSCSCICIPGVVAGVMTNIFEVSRESVKMKPVEILF